MTWNVATAEPPEDVTSLLQLDVQPPTDLCVIGLDRERSGKEKQTSALVDVLSGQVGRIERVCSICVFSGCRR